MRINNLDKANSSDRSRHSAMQRQKIRLIGWTLGLPLGPGKKIRHDTRQVDWAMSGQGGSVRGGSALGGVRGVSQNETRSR